MCILLYVKLTSCCGIPQIYGQLQGYICPGYMCILLHVTLYLELICCSGIPQIYGQAGGLGGGEHRSWYICILLYVKLTSCCGIPQIYGQLEGGYICPGYMCILLHLKLIWCSGIPQIYVQLEGGIHLPWVYVHSPICENYLVQWYSIDVQSIGGGRPLYICILLYLKLIWCSGIIQIYGQLEQRRSWYMCILLYVKLTSCCSGISQILWSIGEGVHLPLVYLHSAIT